MLRRLHHEQPESFAFTAENQAWAEAQITKYPAGRQASAIIPLLWRAQEQEGWLSRPAIEAVAEMLGMAYIRALEVATFYFMFQLQPVGSVAHVQVCGTTSCMICGAEELMELCKTKIAARPHELSADGRFSWEEVECLGACANAPMAQIGKDYYEDLTPGKLEGLLDEMAAGRVPTPGPQNGRYASEPASGLTSLKAYEEGRDGLNASARLAADIGDTIKRIDGTEVPLRTPWQQADEDTDADGRDELLGPKGPTAPQGGRSDADAAPPRNVGEASDKTSEAPGEAPETEALGHPEADVEPAHDERTAESEPGAPVDPPEDRKPAHGSAPDNTPLQPAEGDDAATSGESAPRLLDAPEGEADDLKQLKGIGPQLARQLNELGIYHFSQIAAWGEKEIAWVDARLKFKGRIERDGWVQQAKDRVES
ncbi:NADH:ubiquinone oxidoreductase 41 kD complex I subunit [Oceanicola granulosus HTCC2516]|uniref:NADH:ubiquinone oxidoreductase 41 kD complex I subunit n=1 Tax=Oceanicola granulosus (strain ATCC BAA-861 / DSM 15982 / KCTC 12143 / HTCC2516) TaxID=314256 RepID=Q2CIY7_OCEGH|nr:NADH-quinone oxidoreductase subunit E [Oceanicola granulosus]EAR52813.1 NADH:ubiquinone oxidoreductase 41 kD complex I subunit [Oceanicola granulosus HTCC2516]